MTDLTVRQKVQGVVTNLASSWNGGEPLLDYLAASVPNSSNPYAAFRRLTTEALDRLFGSSESQASLDVAVDALDRYMNRETWFDRAAAADTALDNFRRHPIAYFCAEFGVEDWLPIYSGGLGILAGDVLKESSDLGLPLVAIGLFYRHGYFNQVLDNTGNQSETYPTLDPLDLPMSPVLDGDGSEIVLEIPFADCTLHARAWEIHVGSTVLYLLDTDTPENVDEDDRNITAKLYGGDQQTRIRQEVVLGIGGVRLLRRLEIDPAVYSMNEGHAAFLGIELLAEELEHTGLDAALAEVRQRVVYTNHTVVPAGNDMFTTDLVDRCLGTYAASRGIDSATLLGLATQGNRREFSMAVLAFKLSGKANGVSHIHAGAINHSWPGFAVETVTNGVHVPTWLGPEFRVLLDEYVPDWRGDSPDWNQVNTIPAKELWTARQAQRRRMLAYVADRGAGPTSSTALLKPDVLTVVWARRFAEYKRAGLIARDLNRLSNLLTGDPNSIQLIIAGKAHPRDEGGKNMMQELLASLAQDRDTAAHVVFIPDYNIKIARYLTMGADLWLNTPRKPLEASGTSGMKSSDNGGLQLTVRDGWAEEVEWYQTGWGIDGDDDDADAAQLYDYLEQSVVPAFYSRDSEGIPAQWTAMMKNSMIVTLSRYSMRRMMLEYMYKLYLPLTEEQTTLSAMA